MRATDRRRRDLRRAVIGWLVALALALAMLIPNGLVLVGTRKAKACFQSFEAPRGAELPWCGDAMGWFSFPARVPWTITPATYRAEELRIRVAAGHYQNAIAGKPDREARTKAAELVEQAANIVRTGSRRVAFEELGPEMGAPDPGQDAVRAGDRDTLLARGKEWGEWHQRLHTLRAALLENDDARALDVARHYATYDPREEDLRAALGAILCLRGEEKRGIDMFLLQQNDRAARRYAAMSRNWGDVRTALLACAALGKTTPPPRPASSEAGQDDHRVVRSVLRLRVSAGDAQHLREAQEAARQLLSSALPAGARAPILAALLASGATFSAETWADFASARTSEGEPPLLDLGSVNVLSWIEIPIDRPLAVGSVFERGAEKLMAIAAGPEKGAAESKDAGAGAKKKDADGTNDAGAGAGADPRPLLEAAAGALWIEGARASVRGGDTKAALAMLERAAPLVKMDATTRALAEGIVRYATGDVEGAHQALAAAPAPVPGEPLELSAALSTLRAEVSGQWGPPSKAEAQAAFDAVEKTKSAALRAWVRRVRFWADPGSEPAADVSVASLDVMEGRFALWPSLGYANRTVQWGGTDDPRLSLLERNLAVWSAARGASENDRRAFRYALLRHRGDMPDAMVPYLAVAATLAGEGDAEVWLDAVMAIDAPRFSMRAYAWARAMAARGRGDRESFALWMKRYQALAKLAGDAERAELARLLGI